MNRSEAGRIGHEKAKAGLEAAKQRVRAEAERKALGKQCAYCTKPIPFEKRRNTYCSHSCSASVTNVCKPKRREQHTCPCGASVRFGHRFCSQTCFQHKCMKDRTALWLAGDEAGGNVIYLHWYSAGCGMNLSPSTYRAPLSVFLYHPLAYVGAHPVPIKMGIRTTTGPRIFGSCVPTATV